MKKQKKVIFWFVAAFLLLFNFSSAAQNPTYTCNITGAEQMSCNVFEFDVMMQRTGTIPLELSAFQLAININSAIIPAGGVVNVAPVPGSSTLQKPSMVPGPDRFGFIPATNTIQVTAVPPPGFGNGSIIAQFPALWTKLLRIRVACSLPFVNGTSLNPVWSYSLPPGYATKIAAYVNTTNIDITVQASHTLVVPYNLTFTNSFASPVPQTVLSDMTQVCLNPGAGATISLASTEAGYTYYLYKDGVPVSTSTYPDNNAIIYGNGSAQSFGRKLTSGVISVKSVGCSGLIDMANTITLTPVTPLVTNVSIGVSQNNLCTPADPVTFIATPTNGGTTPSYQWYLNTLPVGTDQPTYSYTPANGDKVFVSMTSSETCVTANPKISDTITMAVLPNLPASVSLVADTNNICSGTNVTFTATPTNGGTPSYQWYKNTIPVGTNQPTYSYAPADGDEVYVVMTSNALCVTGNPASSSVITMNVNPTFPVSVTIAVDQNNLCAPAVPVIFTATPTNGGIPTYQWYRNNMMVGTNQPTYTLTPVNNDQIKVIMTSNLLCATSNPATSSTIAMVVNPVLTANVSIGVNQNNVCAGTTVNFTATPFNGGTPSYQWIKNSLPVGTNQPTYSYVPVNGDQVYCVMTSTAPCVTGSPATSSTITMNVNTPLPVSVSISSLDTNHIICLNQAKTFNATPTNGGTPTYSWKKNGVSVGTNSPTYVYTSSVISTDSVWVVMTSSLGCISGSPATSSKYKIIVSPCTGIEEDPSAISSIVIYPNPTNDKLFVNFNDVKEVPQSMRLFNSFGQLCFISDAPLLVNEYGIDVSKYVAGTYIVQIVFESGLVNKTFIVE